MNEDKKSVSHHSRRLVSPGGGAAIALIACAVFFGATWWAFHSYVGDEKPDHLGTRLNDFGVFFGGVLGPALSAFSFLALVYTVLLQIALGEEAKGQSTRATFFEMVSLHNQIVKDITHEYTSVVDVPPTANQSVGRMVEVQVVLEGRKALHYFFDVGFRTYYLREVQRARQQPKFSVENFDTVSFGNFYSVALNDIGHYFRNLYRIFKFIDESDLSEKDKKSLAGLLRAQLSNSELALLFYNGKALIGLKFKPLLEKYAMFENMNMGTLLEAESARDYKATAYGDAIGNFFTYVGVPQKDEQ